MIEYKMTAKGQTGRLGQNSPISYLEDSWPKTKSYTHQSNGEER